jgi:hypothetical protein
VGRYYTQPRQRCECGSRVLHLLYCYTCGEQYVGGWLVRTRDAKILSADPAKIDYEGVVEKRSLDNFLVLWPSAGRGPDSTPIKLAEHANGFEIDVPLLLGYFPVALDYKIGEVRTVPESEATHYAYELRLRYPNTRIEGARDQLRLLCTDVPATPVCCARCGDNNYRATLPKEKGATFERPTRIGSASTSFAKRERASIRRHK